MRTMKKLAVWVALAVAGAGAQAALVDRGGGMIYDTTLNITWLADMDYVRTSGYSATLLRWDAANVWVSSLVYGGYSDWRMPGLLTDDPTCDRFEQYNTYRNCTGGELSHLFVVDLGNKRDESVLNQVGDTGEQISNLALFKNVRGTSYWSGTEFRPGLVWEFDSQDGSQNLECTVCPGRALAVRDGDVAVVAATAIPEPESLSLVALAVGLAFGIRNLRRG